MLKPVDYCAIIAHLHSLGLKGLANELYWYSNTKCLRYLFKKGFPECYRIITTPIRMVPLYINHEEEYIRDIASYRLKQNR